MIDKTDPVRVVFRSDIDRWKDRFPVRVRTDFAERRTRKSSHLRGIMNCKTEFANHEARIRRLEELLEKLSTSPEQPMMNIEEIKKEGTNVKIIIGS